MDNKSYSWEEIKDLIKYINKLSRKLNEKEMEILMNEDPNKGHKEVTDEKHK